MPILTILYNFPIIRAHYLVLSGFLFMGEKEIWKDIHGYEGMYQVSNLGRVKSFIGISERILKHNAGNRGYFFFRLYKNRKPKTFTTHQLVAMSFLGHVPNGHELVVNHKNLNKHDNRVENLEIITQRENCNLKHIKSSSKYVGVCWDKQRNKWFSYIYMNGKRKHLGRFINEYDAHLAYEKALSEL